jgi:two-component system alkaline phosphatase synthesis response regulator PhoP
MTKKRKARTVLIIEDDTDIRNFAMRVLEMEGYNVLEANDGEKGMEIIRETTLDIVVLDLRLPGRDGWSVLDEIRHSPSLSSLPVVVISAVAETTQRRRTMRMGANRYLIKPMSANCLARTVAKTLHQDKPERKERLKGASAR